MGQIAAMEKPKYEETGLAWIDIARKIAACALEPIIITNGGRANRFGAVETRLIVKPGVTSEYEVSQQIGRALKSP